MLEDIIQNRYAVTAVILFGIGFTNLMLQQNLLRKVIGFNIMDSAVFLLLASLGSAAFIGLRAGAPGAGFLLAGGCLFLCSDGILAFETFRDGDSNAADVAVMLTYIAAQALLAVGFAAG